mmetsp:Transcript_17387/g.48270  ORF Transcript_17387/g.48270 Transcript_17387/m.48270 type:complete len:302 (-) Transcript_17387:2867-3772(-)
MGVRAHLSNHLTFSIPLCSLSPVPLIHSIRMHKAAVLCGPSVPQRPLRRKHHLQRLLQEQQELLHQHPCQERSSPTSTTAACLKAHKVVVHQGRGAIQKTTTDSSSNTNNNNNNSRPLPTIAAETAATAAAICSCICCLRSTSPLPALRPHPMAVLLRLQQRQEPQYPLTLLLTLCPMRLPICWTAWLPSSRQSPSSGSARVNMTWPRSVHARATNSTTPSFTMPTPIPTPLTCFTSLSTAMALTTATTARTPPTTTAITTKSTTAGVRMLLCMFPRLPRPPTPTPCLSPAPLPCPPHKCA